VHAVFDGWFSFRRLPTGAGHNREREVISA
jgi:hypothetical protein